MPKVRQKNHRRPAGKIQPLTGFRKINYRKTTFVVRGNAQDYPELWIQFPDMDAYRNQENNLYRILMDSEGDDEVIIYVRKEKMKKVLPASRNVKADQELLERLAAVFGEKNVKAVEKRIENRAQID